VVELEQKARQRIRLNNICILGAALGVASLPLVWFYDPPTMLGPYDPHNYPTVIWWVKQAGLFASLYRVGVVLSFFTPLGGLLQLPLIGVSVIAMIESGSETPLDGIDPQILPMPGFILGCVSATVVITSTLHWGRKEAPGTGEPPNFVKRLLTYRLD
jgi:hypothetical protein